MLHRHGERADVASTAMAKCTLAPRLRTVFRSVITGRVQTKRSVPASTLLGASRVTARRSCTCSRTIGQAREAWEKHGCLVVSAFGERDGRRLL